MNLTSDAWVVWVPLQRHDTHVFLMTVLWIGLFYHFVSLPPLPYQVVVLVLCPYPKFEPYPPFPHYLSQSYFHRLPDALHPFSAPHSLHPFSATHALHPFLAPHALHPFSAPHALHPFLAPHPY
ncbi:hypothetical protein FRX31_029615 [Thalictrum thalictroides]|uniref:Uncharacterized protein n=1 Tax=Thalictrum thalictroides TaxID=46969 RepID=A0A7J6V6S0_THATH|nr:hypothetical protein FRX31_029615 [Thalictrum thalictroides]